MADNVNEQLVKLKGTLVKWNESLVEFNKWAISNDGVIDETEKSLINRLQTEITAINQRIAQIEKAKAGTSQGTQNSSTNTSSLSDSVGKNGKNKEADVKVIQTLLNQKNNAGLVVDGDCGNKTIGAIENFQQKTFGWKDGLISAGGKTWKALNGSTASNNNSTNSNTNNSNTNNNSNNTNNNSNNTNNTVPSVTGSTGTGDEGDETYKNQRDNPVMGDTTCNVTTLTMQLIGLANGDEAKVMKSALDLCKKHKISGMSESTQLEEILRRLTIVAAGNKEIVNGIPAWQWSWVLDAAAEMFTDLVSHVDNAGKYMDITSKEKYNSQIVPALQQGAEVMISNKLTSGGHIAFLVSVRDEGIVINDPYGMMVTNHQYVRNAEQISSTKKTLITSNQSIVDTRLKLNAGLKSKIMELIKGTGTFPTNSGEKNFYTWDEVKTYQIGKWCNVAFKKK